MKRGIKAYDEIFKAENEIEEKEKRKGRDKSLILERNQCLLNRYFYYARIKRMKYEDVLKSVSKDFFLSERTIIDIMDKENESFKIIVSENPTINILRKKFDFFQWQV